MKNNQHELLARMIGNYIGIRRAPLTGCSFPYSRILNLRWHLTTKRGLPTLANSRNERRTIDELITGGFINASGTTKDRYHKLTTKGLFTSLSLIADNPSHLKKVMAEIESRASKLAVTFEKDVSAIPFHRSAGFPSAFVALEMIGLVEIGFHCTETTEARAYYALRCTGLDFTFPADKDFPSFDEAITEAFSQGMEEGHELAGTALPVEYKNEVTGLADFRIKSFKDAKTEKQFKQGKGIFSTDGF
jgi:hypothetical protein